MAEQITRNDVIIVDKAISDEIFQGAINGSKILGAMTRLPDMTTGAESINLSTQLVEGYWVNGDSGLKATSKAMWEKKYLYAEELAVIVPIPDNVKNDADYDILENLKPQIISAFYRKLDEAIISGKNKPARFRDGLIPSILNAGNKVTATNSLYNDISEAMGLVEEDGYNPNSILGGVGLKKAFRDGLRDSNGQPLANSDVTELNRYFVDNGAWDSKVKAIVGDFSQAVYAFREDIKFEITNQAVITDADGKVVLNLFQQDMTAIRATMRIGWEIPNPVNALNGDEATRFPFAYIENTSAPTSYDVTFTVQDESASAVEGAKVEFGGQRKTTNSSGVAVFKSLGNAKYNYKVTKAGKVTVESEVAVETSAVNKTITLIAR